MRIAHIKNISGLVAYIQNNSAWQATTIRNVIQALGCTCADSLKDLSSQLVNVAQHGADGGFSGFIYYADTIRFFQRNRKDIVHNIEQTAVDMGEDVIPFVQSFGVFRNTTPPTSAQIGRALWDSAHIHDELTSLYNVFSWYALEDISHVWYRYLEDNPGYYAKLSA